MHKSIIAHRGFAGIFPENTMAAFKGSLNLNAKGLELDVHLSKDKKVVVFHDPRFTRVANRKDCIGDLSLEEIKRLDVGIKFNSRYKGEKVPTLEEVLELVGNKATVYIEVKKGLQLYEGIEKRILGLIKESKSKHNCVLHSFQASILHTISSLDSKFPLMLTRDKYRTLIHNPSAFFNTPTMKLKGMMGLNLNHKFLSAGLVKKIHQQKLKVFAWTVNSNSRNLSLQEMGVDGMISNYPLGTHY